MTWYNSNWPYRKRITIDGTKISGNQTDFQLLYRLSGSDIFAHASANARDIIFTDDDEITRIHHEIDTFSNGSGIIWVRIPTLVDETSKNIYMYYGYLDGGNQTEIAGYKESGTWDSVYKLVYHLNDYPDNQHIKDSTTWHNSGTKSAANQPKCMNVSGAIGSGQYFIDAQNAHISAQHIAAYDFTDVFTLSAWVNWVSPNIGDEYGYVNCWYDNLDPFGLFVGGATDTNLAKLALRTADKDSNFGASGVPLAPRVIHYIVGVYDGDEARLYLDGIPGVSDAEYGGDIQTLTTNLTIGKREDTTTRNYAGLIDEFRIINAVRSRGRLLTEYRNISSTSTFLVTNSEESYSVLAGGAWTLFKTPIGSPTSWIWNSGQFNTDSGMRSTVANGLNWKWETLSGSTNYYVPSGSETSWQWTAETS